MKILYISYFFPPFNTMGGIRALGQVNELTKQGHSVLVCTSFCQGDYPKNIELDQSLRVKYYYEDIKNTYQEKTEKSYLFSILFKLQKTLPLFYLFAACRIIFQEHYSKKGHWRMSLYEDMNNIQLFNPDVIYASYSPLSSLIAARWLSKKLNVPWYAEMRDSFSYNPVTSDFKSKNFATYLLLLYERLLLREANGIICATDFIYKYYKSRFKSKKISKIYNGSDELKLNGKSRLVNTKKINITHCGSLLHGRKDPRILLEVISKNNMFRNSFCVNFFGRDTDNLKNFIKNEGFEDFVEIGGEISYADAKKTENTSDINLLLMIDSKNEKYSLTGKIFDLVATEKTILMLYGTGSEAEKVLKASNIPFICANGFSELNKFLETFLNKQRTKNKEIHKFSREIEVKKLIEFMEN